MENKKLFITDTILRDAHQSQAATRMRIEDMIPMLEELDKVGYIKANESCETKTEGLFVAGDSRTKDIRQVATAVGDGATAATKACKYLQSLGE